MQTFVSDFSHCAKVQEKYDHTLVFFHHFVQTDILATENTGKKIFKSVTL